jgi:hypothetical protein
LRKADHQRKITRMKFSRALIVALMVVAPVRAAQPERIIVRMTPTPNQTIHTRATQETTMEIEPDATAPASLPMPAMNLVMTMTMGHTMTVGAPNEQGHYEARITLEEMTGTTTMNGQPAPFPIAVAKLAGQTITVTYDQEGKPVDVGGTSGLGAALEPMRQMMAGAFGAIPTMTLAIGETATAPLNLALPIPMAGGSMAVTGSTKFTLTSLSYDGVDRIAHLTTTMAGQMNQTPDGGAAGLGFEMKMTGEGTMDVNVDRGFAQASEQVVTIRTQMGSRAIAGVNTPPMQVHGTVKLSQTTVPD